MPVHTKRAEWIELPTVAGSVAGCLLHGRDGYRFAAAQEPDRVDTMRGRLLVSLQSLLQAAACALIDDPGSLLLGKWPLGSPPGFRIRRTLLFLYLFLLFPDGLPLSSLASALCGRRGSDRHFLLYRSIRDRLAAWNRFVTARHRGSQRDSRVRGRVGFLPLHRPVGRLGGLCRTSGSVAGTGQSARLSGLPTPQCCWGSPP